MKTLRYTSLVLTLLLITGLASSQDFPVNQSELDVELEKTGEESFIVHGGVHFDEGVEEPENYTYIYTVNDTVIHESDNPLFEHELSWKPSSLTAEAQDSEGETVIRDQADLELQESEYDSNHSQEERESFESWVGIGQEKIVEINKEGYTLEGLSMVENSQEAKIRINDREEEVTIGESFTISEVEFRLEDLEFSEDGGRMIFEIYPNGNEIDLVSTEDSTEDESREQEESSEIMRDLLPVGAKGEITIGDKEHVIEVVNVEPGSAAVRTDGELESFEPGDINEVSEVEFEVIEIRKEGTQGVVFEIDKNGQNVRFGETTVENESESSEPREPVDTPVERPEGTEVDINVDSENLVPGEKMTARASIETEKEDVNLSYDWRLRNIAEEDTKVIENGGESIDLQVRDPERTPNRGSIGVKVEKDGRTVGTQTKDLQYKSYSPDVEGGLNTEYSDEKVEIKAEEEELRERPVVFMGQSVDPLSEVRIHPVNLKGGTKLKIESTEDYEEAPSNLKVYNVFELSGENIDGLRTELRSDISHEWLQKRNLMISRREADISYYKVTENGWERIPSRIGYAEADEYMRLNSKPVRSREDEYLLSGEKRIAVAGDKDGITLGRYALTDQGECREIEGDQQIPPGWEELDVTCDTVEQAERVERTVKEAEEEIQRTKEEIEKRGIELTEKQNQRLNRHEEEIEDAKSDLDNYRVYDARSTLEENRESFRDLQRDLMERSETSASSASRRPGRNVDEMVQSVQEELPEELKENLTYPEEIQEKKDEIETLREQGDSSEAAELSRELVEDLEQSEEFQRLETKREVYESIEDFKQRDRFNRLDNETQKELYTAEDQLYNGSVEQAEATLNSFERSAQIQLMRNMILEALQDEEVRKAVQDVIAEVIPGM